METSEVRLSENKSEAISLLEIATRERRSVLGRVRALLFDLRVEIVRVESLVKGEGLLERFEIVELDGGPLSRRRAAAIRSTVRRALRRGAAPEAAA